MSILRLRLSDHPSRSSPCRSAATSACMLGSSSTPGISTPIRRIPPPCCALAASGHAAAEAPRRLMNSRLLSRMASLLLNHFVGKNLDLLRDREPERVRDLEVENELKPCRCLTGRSRGFGPLR